MQQQIPQIPNQTNLTKSTNICIKCLTWQKKSHSLFDYETHKQMRRNQMNFTVQPQSIGQNQYYLIYRNKLNSDVNFMRKKKSNDQTKQGEWINENHTSWNYLEILGVFVLRTNNYEPKNKGQKRIFVKFLRLEDFQMSFIDPLCQQFGTEPSNSKSQQQKNQVGIIVRTYRNQNSQSVGYKLKKNQTIKFGKLQLDVIIREEDGIDLETELIKNGKQLEVLEQPEENQCRVCLSHKSLQENKVDFLCSPCKCLGSVRLIHFQCLKYWWQENKKLVRSLRLVKCIIPHSKCEMCKAPFQSKFIYKNKLYRLEEFTKFMDKPCMILSPNTNQNTNDMCKGFVFLNKQLVNRQINIGRSVGHAIRCSDSSVSRNHSKIVQKQDGYYIYDQRSKFGTIVCEPGLQFEITRSRKGVQIGRTIIIFSTDEQGSNQQIEQIEQQRQGEMQEQIPE